LLEELVRMGAYCVINTLVVPLKCETPNNFFLFSAWLLRVSGASTFFIDTRMIINAIPIWFAFLDENVLACKSPFLPNSDLARVSDGSIFEIVAITYILIKLKEISFNSNEIKNWIQSVLKKEQQYYLTCIQDDHLAQTSFSVSCFGLHTTSDPVNIVMMYTKVININDSYCLKSSPTDLLATEFWLGLSFLCRGRRKYQD